MSSTLDATKPQIAAPTRLPISDALVSVVLPVYNEVGALIELCQRLRAALSACRTTFELIFVDDGSRDGSTELLDRLARHFPEVRVIHLSRNFGHQAAIHAGLSHAAGDAVILMDSDLQDSPEAVAKLLQAWQSGYDVVYAVRTRRKEWLPKRLLFAAFHRFLAGISQTYIPVDAGNFGLVDARVARAIVSLGERDRYLPGLRSWVGFKQIGVPVERGPRYDDRPRVSLLGLVRLAKTAVFSFSAIPLAMFAWIGWLALGLFLAVSGASLYFRIFTDLAVPGWTSQLVTFSFFAALNALGISMLGEYVVRIYDQVRQRPLYLIDRTTNMDRAAESMARDNENRAAQLNLEQLDPLELDTAWDGAYQHLLHEANELLELGELARSEAADLADRSTREHCVAEFAAPAAEPSLDSMLEDAADAEPQVFKLSDARR